MKGYVLSPRAQTDIGEIGNYSIELWGTTQAESYIRGIRDAVEDLAANPRHGRACDDIRAGYFKYPVGSHVLFYRLTASGIDVVRILHRRMDFDRHL